MGHAHAFTLIYGVWRGHTRAILAKRGSRRGTSRIESARCGIARMASRAMLRLAGPHADIPGGFDRNESQGSVQSGCSLGVNLLESTTQHLT